MSATVTLCSDSNDFHNRWRPALQQHGLRARTCMPDELASVVQSGSAVIIDAYARGVDEDELLTTVGFLAGLGCVPIVQLAPVGVLASADDVIVEICGGLVIGASEDPSRVVRQVQRRLDQQRARRFDFVTLSPRPNELLAILGDGRATLLRRPLSELDDGSEVVQIALSDGAREAHLELASGARLELSAGALTKSSNAHLEAVANGEPIDGAELGARLRTLRLEAGLTQAELARRTGIHRPNIARVEAGKHTPSLETLARLATAMGLSTTRVLSRD